MNKVYWVWHDGIQYQITFCECLQEWSMIRDDSGRAY
jgi:hypothetical protein